MYFQKTLKSKKKKPVKETKTYLLQTKKVNKWVILKTKKIILVNLFEFQDRNVPLIGKLNT